MGSLPEVEGQTGVASLRRAVEQRLERGPPGQVTLFQVLSNYLK